VSVGDFLDVGTLVRWREQTCIVTKATHKAGTHEPSSSRVDVLCLDGYTRTFVRKPESAVYRLGGSERADDVLHWGLA
jgi:hypothetical protein